MGLFSDTYESLFSGKAVRLVLLHLSEYDLPLFVTPTALQNIQNNYYFAKRLEAPMLLLITPTGL